MANPKKLSYITVDGSGCQTTYYAGQYFNPSGVVVTAHYTNGTSATVAMYLYGPTSQLAVTDTAITFTYSESGVTKTAQLPISVLPANTPVSLSASLSSSVVYYAGEHITSRGLSITVYYGGGGSRSVAFSECSVSVNGVPSGALSAGANAIALSLTEGGATVSASLSLSCPSLPASLQPAWPGLWRGLTLGLVLPVPLARFNPSGYPLSLDATWVGDATAAAMALSPELPGNWLLSIKARVLLDSGTYKLLSGDGSVCSFDRMLSSSYYARRGGGTEVLQVLSSGYRIEDAEGTVLSFDSAGRLTSAARFGTGLTYSLSYVSGTDRLSSYSYSGGTASVAFSYGQNGFLSTVTLMVGQSAAAAVSCGYDSQNRLASLSYSEPGGPSTALWAFDYASNGTLRTSRDARSGKAVRLAQTNASLDGLTAAMPRLISVESGVFEGSAFTATETVERTSASTFGGSATRLDLRTTRISAGPSSTHTDVTSAAFFLRGDGSPAAAYPVESGSPRPPRDDLGKAGSISGASTLQETFGGTVCRCGASAYPLSFGTYPAEPQTASGHCTFAVTGYVRLLSSQEAAFLRLCVNGQQYAYQPLDGSVPGVFQRIELGLEKAPSPSITIAVLGASGAPLPFDAACLRAYLGPVSGASLGGNPLSAATQSTVYGSAQPDWLLPSDALLSKRELAASLSRPRIFYSRGGRRKRFYPASGSTPSVAFFGNSSAALSAPLASSSLQKIKDLSGWSPRTLSLTVSAAYSFSSSGSAVSIERTRSDERLGETLSYASSHSRQYDHYGRELSRTDQLEGASVTTLRHYDSAGNLDKVYRQSGGSELVLEEAAYDSDGRPTLASEGGEIDRLQYDSKARPWKRNPRQTPSGGGTPTDDWPLAQATYDSASDPVRYDFSPDSSGSAMANVASYFRGAPSSRSVEGGPGHSVSWTRFPELATIRRTGPGSQAVDASETLETAHQSYRHLRNLGCSFDADYLCRYRDARGRLAMTSFDPSDADRWSRTYRSDYGDELTSVYSSSLTAYSAMLDQDTQAPAQITTRAASGAQSFVTENADPAGNGGYRMFGDVDAQYDEVETVSPAYSAYCEQTPAAHGGSLLPTLSSFYRYDAFGRLSKTLRWCDDEQSPAWSEQIQYLSRGSKATALPTQVEMRFAGYSSEYVETLAWDGRNRPASSSLLGYSHSYSYDGFSRLSGYSVSGTGVATGQCVCAYDSLGNLTFDGPSGNGTSFSYGVYGTLSSMTRPGGATVTYAYDDGGRRVQRAEGGATKNYLYQGWRLTAAGSATYAYDEAGRVVRRGDVEYYYARDGRMVSLRSGTDRMRFFYDARGAVGFLYTSQAQGFETSKTVCHYVRSALGDVVGIVRVNSDGTATRIATYVYDPWGLPLLTSETAPVPAYVLLNPFRYRGYFYDRYSGLYILGARAYDPESRCFLTPDDLGYLRLDVPHGLLPYAYCLNNPTAYSDPTGHIPLLLSLVILGAIGAITNFAAQSLTDLATGQGFDWGRSGIAAAAGFFGGMAMAIPLAGLNVYISAALTSGLNAIGQMAYSGKDYGVGDYFTGFAISAIAGVMSSWVFGKLTSCIPFFANTDFFLSNFVTLTTKHHGVGLPGSIVARLAGQVAWRGFLAGMAESAFDIPFSWAADQTFGSWMEWDGRKLDYPGFGW